MSDLVLTVEMKFDTSQRRAIAKWYGKRGLASERLMLNWCAGVIRAALDDVVTDADIEAGKFNA